MTVDWPLEFNKIRRGLENHTFGMVRKHANGTSKPHQGWDFSADIGTAVYAIGAGKVEFVKHKEGDYGTQICHSFEHGGKKYYAFYAHLDTVLVTAGQKVLMGQFIGTSGESGNAKGMAKADRHLHFEIRERAYCGTGLTDRISPLKIFGLCPLKVVAEKRSKQCPSE